MRWRITPNRKGVSTNSLSMTGSSRRTAVRIFSQSLLYAAKAYKSMAATPMIQMTLAMKSQICSGSALVSGLGAADSRITWFTALSTNLTPLSITGPEVTAMSCRTVSRLGIRLNTLSREKGHASRNATSAHSRQ